MPTTQYSLAAQSVSEQQAPHSVTVPGEPAGAQAPEPPLLEPPLLVLPPLELPPLVLACPASH